MRDLSRLKLCFLAGTLEHGGAERQLFYILQSLSQAGASLRLLSLDRGEFWEEKMQGLGIEVACIGDSPSRMKRLFRLLQELRKDPPDVLQSQHFFANAYAGLAARFLSASGIGALRNNGRSELSGSGRLGGWLNLHSPAMIAANSRTALRFALDRGIPASRLYFLPNVVDTQWFKSSPARSEQPLTLIAVGRLVKQKRLDRFIALLALLRQKFGLDVKGMVVGPGGQGENLQPALEDQARRLGLLPNTLQFWGGLADMRPAYAEASVCVLTSDFEGTPNVLLEAMASGLPVVAADVGGVSDIVRHRVTGFLCAPDDLVSYANALVELARHTPFRMEMGQRAREFVELNHSLTRLPVYLSGLYDLALPLRRRPAAPVAQSAST